MVAFSFHSYSSWGSDERGPTVVEKNQGSGVTPSPFLLHRECEHLNVCVTLRPEIVPLRLAS